jgi:hypothetical protein
MALFIVFKDIVAKIAGSAPDLTAPGSYLRLEYSK